MDQFQPKRELPFTELERAKLDACGARRVAFQAQAQALELMARENNATEAAIVAAATARVEVEAANSPGSPNGAAGNAEVVELRRDGPAPAAA